MTIDPLADLRMRDILREELATPPDQLPDYSPLARDTATHVSSAVRLAPYAFPAGVSGNPGGVRKRPPTLQEVTRRVSDVRLERMVDAVAKKAEEGDLRAFQEFRDTRDGKPASRIVVEQADGSSPFIDALRAIRQEIAEARGQLVEGEARLVDGPQEQAQE